jgi:opacity protein-like surface antigen
LEDFIMSRGFRIHVLALMVFAIAMPALAQETSGARVSGFFSGAFGEGATNIGVGGSAGYRFTPHIGLDFEVLALPGLEFDDTNTSGRGVAFLTNFVTEFPSGASWLTPYVQGGGGIANVTQGLNLPFLDRGDGRFPMPRGFGQVADIIDDIRGNLRRRAETSLALSVGGGVDFGIWRGLAVGPTITYMRLFGSFEDIDLTRVGAKATYRF